MKKHKEINPKFIWTALMLGAVGMILLSVYLVINEISDARKECNSIGGLYSVEFFAGHLCNGEKFIKYNSCMVLGNKMDCNLEWVFENSIEEINISQFLK